MGQETDGLETGLRLRFTAGEGCVVSQSVLLGQIEEWETVAEQEGLRGRLFDRPAVTPVQCLDLFLIGREIGLIDRSVLRIGSRDGFLDAPAEDLRIGRGEPHMLIVFQFFRFLFSPGLHSRNGLLLPDAASQRIHQVHRDHVRIDCLPQGILHPGVRLAAHIDEHIAVRDLHHVLGGGLETVQVHAGIQEQSQVSPGRILPQDVPGPVIQGEDGGDDLQLPGVLTFLSIRSSLRLVLTGPAGRAEDGKRCHHKYHAYEQ